MNWLQWLDIPLKALAVVIGAAWVLMNYLRGRTHKPRLQLRVFAERVLRNKEEYLIVKTELSNVGLTRVDVRNDGCVITIYGHRLPKHLPIVMQPRWKELAHVDLYKDQKWVEPNGLLIDSNAVALPGLSDTFLKVWAHFEATTVALNATVVVPPLAPTGSAPMTVPEDEKGKMPG